MKKNITTIFTAALAGVLAKNPNKILNKKPEKNLGKTPEKKPEKTPEKKLEKTPEKKLEKAPEKKLEKTPEKKPEKAPEKKLEKAPEKKLGKKPEKNLGGNFGKNPNKILVKNLTSFQILAATIFISGFFTNHSFAWTGYDYSSGSEIEIGAGNLVREGEEIRFYDWNADEERRAEVRDVDYLFNSARLEVYDYLEQKIRIFEMGQ